MRVPVTVLVSAALLLAGSIFPRFPDEEKTVLSMQRVQRTLVGHRMITAMTFNIRLDGEEANTNNHFTRRLPRIASLFDKVRPHIVGLQEPFAGQLLHTLSELPSRYQHVGFERENVDVAHRRRQNDYKVAILFDAERLELLERDYLWLSDTPRREGSKSWGSLDSRTLNVVRMLDRLSGMEIIAFNTHLDVRSEEARREQAKIVSRNIQDWHRRYPDAMVLLFGDFNSCPGQKAHTILSTESGLLDAWDSCVATSDLNACEHNDVAHTFHGWTGASFLNSFVGRALLTSAFIMHGSGLETPISMPNTARMWLRAVRDVIMTRPKFSMTEAIPAWPFDRLHVDWIFHSAEKLIPRFVGVLDAREADFSSDHFPVVGVFETKQNKYGSGERE